MRIWKRVTLTMAGFLLCSLQALAQPYEIVHAEYGARDTWRDVTSQLRSLIRNGMLDTRVENDFLGGDPRPAELKTLRIEVRDRGGRSQVLNFREGDRVSLPVIGGAGWNNWGGGIRPGMRGELRIVKAIYGVPSRGIDVTSLLNRMVQYGGLSVRVTNEAMGGDPAPATAKNLSVAYEWRGQRRQVTVQENDTLILPEGGYPGGGNSSEGNWSGGNLNDSRGDLQILRASYGTEGQTSDVTNRLARQIRENRLRIRVTNDNMGGDPNPGPDKELMVVYQYRGERRQTTAREGQYLELPTDNSAPMGAGGDWRNIGSGDLDNVGSRNNAGTANWNDARNGLRLFSAFYGYQDRTNDVAERLSRMIRDGRLSIKVTNENMGGDPYPGPDKQLVVLYEYRGERKQALVKEGDTLNLP